MLARESRRQEFCGGGMVMTGYVFDRSLCRNWLQSRPFCNKSERLRDTSWCTIDGPFSYKHMAIHAFSFLCLLLRLAFSPSNEL